MRQAQQGPSSEPYLKNRELDSPSHPMRCRRPPSSAVQRPAATPMTVSCIRTFVCPSVYPTSDFKGFFLMTGGTPSVCGGPASHALA